MHNILNPGRQGRVVLAKCLKSIRIVLGPKLAEFCEQGGWQ